jgi:membrane-bound lytic murein transglycosylase D
MAEIALLWDLVCRRLSLLRAYNDSKTFEKMKLRLLGCAVVLVAGCSTFGSHQASSVAPSDQAARAAAAAALASAIRPPTPLPTKNELIVPDQPSIDFWVRSFSEDKHKSFQIQLQRARFYALPAQEIFERAGLPKDLIYVALIESGFSPTARSSASAVGMWQFIASTGKRFGLEQNRWIDERRHPMKAAKAAADYLSFLYDTFGSWPLALAAYNAGEKGVQDALDQSGLKTFWDLAETGYLPAETRDYVPKVLAAIKILRNPAQYGFHFNPEHYVKWKETIPAPGGVKLSWICKHSGIPEYELEVCNPELCRSITPPDCPIYPLSVPVGTKDAVLAALAERPLHEEKPVEREPEARPHSGSVLHKVKPGETLFGLARSYGCSTKSLAQLNDISPSKPLKAGRTIKIPSGSSSSHIVVAKAVEKEHERVVSKHEGKNVAHSGKEPSKHTYYTVRRGDTIWSIAERFHIPVKLLCADNRLKPGARLIPGNLLKIRAGEKENMRMARR